MDQMITPDQRVIEELQRVYASTAYRYLRARVVSDEDAEDIWQTLLLSFWERPPSSLSKRALENWLWSALRHNALDYLRKRHTLVLGEMPVDEKSIADPLTFLEKEDKEEVQESIRRVLDTLPTSEREVIASMYLGLTIQEVASKLGQSPAAVRKAVARAKKRLTVLASRGP